MLNKIEYTVGAVAAQALYGLVEYTQCFIKRRPFYFFYNSGEW